MMNQSDLWHYYKQWQRGLVCCLPAPLRRHIDPSTNPYIVDAADPEALKVFQEFDGDITPLGKLHLDKLNAEPLKSLKAGARRLILRLPSGWALIKRSRFPMATEENLRQVVGFEMDRLTPFSANQVYYDYRIVERLPESAELVVDLAVVPHKRLETLRQGMRKAGLKISVIDTPGGWEGMNLLPPQERPGQSVIGIITNLLMGLLVIGLFVALLATPLWQQRQIAIEMQQRAEQAKAQAMQVTAMREKVDQGLELLNRVPQRRKELPAAVEVLKDLTDMLPDDTWVQQLELKGGKLELRGVSRQATSLIQTLENAPGFEHVGFRSPVLQAQGEERFHLAADLMVSGE